MPRWLARLLWSLRGKRLVCLHLKTGPSVEGILVGRWSGHYILENASLLSAPGAQEARDFFSGHLEVPAEQVIFVQVYAKDGR